MKILALEREKPGRSADDFQALLLAEAQQAWQLYQQGIFRELYFDERQHTAVMVMESDSIASAGAVLATLPLVRFLFRFYVFTAPNPIGQPRPFQVLLDHW